MLLVAINALEKKKAAPDGRVQLLPSDAQVENVLHRCPTLRWSCSTGGSSWQPPGASGWVTAAHSRRGRRNYQGDWFVHLKLLERGRKSNNNPQMTRGINQPFIQRISNIPAWRAPPPTGSTRRVKRASGRASDVTDEDQGFVNWRKWSAAASSVSPGMDRVWVSAGRLTVK